MLVEIMRQKTSEWVQQKMANPPQKEDLQGFMSKIDNMCKLNEFENKKSLDDCRNQQLYAVANKQENKNHTQEAKKAHKMKLVPRLGYNDVRKMPKC